jgi:N6-adenosine-specific RNA methylase IME4
MTELILYDNARHALAEAKRVDEVMTIRNKAKALEAYSRQAKDPEMINMATAIRLRAERRAGELLISMAANGERQAPARPAKQSQETTVFEPPKTLEDLGISKDQSSRWQRVAALPEREFEERVAQTQRLATQSVTMTPFERAQEKKTKRAAREEELGAKIIALPTKKFGFVWADPEWDFEVWSQLGMDRAAANHYRTSPMEVILARDVPSISADDSVLGLWATVPMLPQAMEVMAKWQFTYKSHYIWLKDKVGHGYWNRNKHEIFLIGTRGNVIAPAPGTQWQSVIEAAVGAHSAKPEIFFEMIETYYPTVPKIELNCRGPARANWEAWGDESELTARVPAHMRGGGAPR